MNSENFFVSWILWTAAILATILLGIGLAASLFWLGINFPVIFFIAVIIGISAILADSADIGRSNGL